MTPVDSEPLCDFFVVGFPRSKGSKKAIPIYRGKGEKREFSGRSVVLDQSNPALRDWEAHVRYQAMQAWQGKPMLSEPLEAWLTFSLRRAMKPLPHLKEWPACDPDSEKLSRGVLDALQAVMLKDDNIICRQHIEKKWGDPQGVRVVLRRLIREEE